MALEAAKLCSEAGLFLSEKTVESHLSRIFGKLGVRRRAEVAASVERERSGVG